MQSPDKFDIVYSWGVLHHTGDMWRAIRNASIPLQPGGVFYIALYSPEIYVSPPSSYWLHVKREYNSASNVGKRKMELSYAWRNTVLPALRSGRNPFSVMREYGDRGMTFWTDVRDWLGGYPMDFAGFRETLLFCEKTVNLQLVNCKAGEGNTEFLFARISENERWRDIQNGRQHVALPGPYRPDVRYLYSVDIPALKDVSDTATSSQAFSAYVIRRSNSFRPCSQFASRYPNLRFGSIFSCGTSVSIFQRPIARTLISMDVDTPMSPNTSHSIRCGARGDWSVAAWARTGLVDGDLSERGQYRLRDGAAGILFPPPARGRNGEIGLQTVKKQLGGAGLERSCRRPCRAGAAGR